MDEADPMPPGAARPSGSTGTDLPPWVLVVSIVSSLATASSAVLLRLPAPVCAALVNAANVVAWAAVTVSFLSRAKREPAMARGWRLLAAAMALQSLYEIPPLVAFLEGRPPPSTPNFTDALIALMLPLVLAGLGAWTLGPRAWRLRLRTAMDAVSFALSCFCIFWMAGIGDRVAATPLSTLDALTFVWPLLGITSALGMVLYLGANRRALLRGTLGWLGVGLIGVVVYQYRWMVEGLRGTYYVGHPIDAGLTILAAGFAATALRGGPLTATGDVQETPAMFWSIATCIPALGVLVGDALRGHVEDAVLAMEIAIAILFMSRQLLSLWDVQQLSRTLEARVADRTRDLEASHAALLRTQKLEAVGRLAGGIAHDFNNLLTVMMGHGELLRRSLSPNDPRAEHTTEILSVCDRASKLTRQLLSFAKQQPTAPQVVDATALMLGMEKLLRRLIGDDVALKVHPTQGPRLINIDPGQFEQILTNLVVNARDAMPDGGTVSMALDLVNDDTGPFVQLTVHDTGIGMDQATKLRIFEPFFTTKAPEQGTGLGLATCHGIVNRAGGQILVDSKPGCGTTFQVRLPLATGAPDHVGAPALEPHPGCGHETILVAEDEDSVRALVASALRARGYRVLLAGNGEEAISCARAFAGHIALLVTDTVMPKMNGPAAAKIIRSERPDVRILSMSGYADDQQGLDDLRRAGAHFLAKPFSPAQICHQVRIALDASQSDSSA